MKNRLLPILGFLLITGTALASHSVVPAEDTVRDFYNYRVHHSIEGAPTAAQLTTLSQWLSPRLCAQLAKAGKEKEDFIRKHGDSEKPPWCEGDLFSSIFEGPSSYEIAGGVSERDKATVQVIFSHSEPHNKSLHWADRVELKWINGKWLIDDILYDLPVEFGNKGSLHLSLP